MTFDPGSRVTVATDGLMAAVDGMQGVVLWSNEHFVRVLLDIGQEWSFTVDELDRLNDVG